ncbi:hypothetical protein GCM10022255_108210 [Dactylosporangium darangshiense]|uniref:Transposase n=1 Tax=Dactylosporangium darangshiense TaxID=579108 RepID=A0ABP8DTW4_9ACTN
MSRSVLLLVRDAMAARFELTDPEWDLLAPLLPTKAPRGGRWQGISRTLTAGQRHDRIGYPAVMAGIRMPAPPRPTQSQARADPGRQGLLHPRDPHRPAPPRHRRHHLRTRRPAGQPPQTWRRRWASADVRR